MRRLRGTSMTVAFALLISACAAAGDGTGSEEESIEDFIAAGAVFDEEYAEDDYRRQELETQEVIAACMAKEGFEYIPYLPNYDESYYGEAETEEEYAEEYGLGVSGQVLSQEFLEEGGTYEGVVETFPGEDDSVEDGNLPDPGEEGDASDPVDDTGILDGLPDEALDDPNWAIREAMSEDEQEAYDEALYGVYPESDYDDMTPEEFEAMSEDEQEAMFEEQEALMEGWDPGGCYNEANEELWDEGAFETFYEQFGDQMEDIYKEAEADPRVTELETKWSKCMSGAGYAFDDEEDAIVHVVGLLEEIGAVSIPVDPESPWDYEPKPIEAGTDTYKQVEAIFKEEVAIAKASLKCWEGADEVYETVYKEYEQAFIDDNRGALEKFREENEQGP